MNVGNILTLIGGLGLFLYGMRVMSDSIEKAAGAKMRSFLAFFTNGSQLCKCRAYESLPGGRRDHGCQYRYHHHITACSF